jgi:hypothetical protein
VPRKPLKVAIIDENGETKIVDFEHRYRPRVIELAPEPKTIKDAMREVLLNVWHGTPVSDKAHLLIAQEWERRQKGSANSKRDTADKVKGWQALAAQYWASHPNASLTAAAIHVKKRTHVALTVGYIRKRIRKK